MVDEAAAASTLPGLAGTGGRAAPETAMRLRWVAPLIVACFALGLALGIVLVDDHPNVQKLTIAADAAQISADRKVISAMVLPCMRLLAASDGASHREGP